MAKARKPAQRFGIAEWYGKSFILLGQDQRQHFAAIQGKPESHQQPCPFQKSPDKIIHCNKTGGVCSLRLYSKDANGEVAIAAPPRDRIRCTCPNRFKQDGTIYQWV